MLSSAFEEEPMKDSKKFLFPATWSGLAQNKHNDLRMKKDATTNNRRWFSTLNREGEATVRERERLFVWNENRVEVSTGVTFGSGSGVEL